jgi:two-component system, response regulator YesN
MYKVAVIEDEPNVRKELVLCSPWEKAGVVFSGEAGDGEEGFELLKKIAPDIVLTDIRMPGFDGLELIRRMKEYCRQSEACREPEWIILSGYTEFEYARRAMQMGVREYLLKPVEEKMLAESLQSCINRIRERERINSITRAVGKGSGLTAAFFSEYSGNISDTFDYVTRTVAIIRRKYIQGVTIEDAACELGISAGYLSRLFKKLTGYTFTDYLMYERISAAARLLKETSKKVYEIADLVGYEDTRYFSQIFKRVTGFTPLEFKNSRGHSSHIMVT